MLKIMFVRDVVIERENMLKEKLLFNPDVVEDLKVFNGTTSNILDLSNIPKESEIFHKLVDTAYGNNWLPHKVPMANDIIDYKNRLTEHDLKGFDLTISFLAFLDSLQTNNLPNIANRITNPHIVYALARQAYDEAIHSKSYGWIFSSIMSKEKANDLYHMWKTNKVLLERNKFIASIYQQYVDKPTVENFIRAVNGNYMLEGVYFYNGFQLFHTFANRGLMIGADTQISYIQRDELVHCSMFENIFNLAMKENEGLKAKIEPMIRDMFKEAVAWEIEFCKESIGDNILGMSNNSCRDNAYYLGNKRLKAIGYEAQFEKKQNPYKHLDKLAGVEDETSNRTNNFEEKSITYKSPEILMGWDNI